MHCIEIRLLYLSNCAKAEVENTIIIRLRRTRRVFFIYVTLDVNMVHTKGIFLLTQGNGDDGDLDALKDTLGL